MINIRLKTQTENGKIIHVKAEAKGHALYNPGNDIVCSAVSTLFFTFAEYLRKGNKETQRSVLKSGNAKIEAEGDIHEAYKMFETGLDMVEKSYKECVCIKKCRLQNKDK